MNFQQEVLKNQMHLNYYALSLTVDESDAKDLTQETLLKAFNYEDRYTDKANLRAWLFTIMKNTFINQYRRDKYRQKLLVNDIASYNRSLLKVKCDNDMDLILIRRDIQYALIALDMKYRVPFVLFYKGYKYKEIAKRLNLPLGTVKSRIYFARKLLTEALCDLV